MRPATTTWPGQQQLLLSRFHANNTQHTATKIFSLVFACTWIAPWKNRGGGDLRGKGGCSRWQLRTANCNCSCQLMPQVLLARTLHLRLPFGPFWCQISAWCGAPRQPRTISDIAGWLFIILWATPWRKNHSDCTRSAIWELILAYWYLNYR